MNFSRKEAMAILTFVGDRKHDRRTRTHLLARCQDEPIRVLDYVREHVTEADYRNDEIIKRIVNGLKKEGFGEKIRFKAPSNPNNSGIEFKTLKKFDPMEIIRRLPYKDILDERGLTGYAIKHLGAA